jgi:MFS family permease
MMMVVATGHFNRTGISVAGAERIIPESGITPDRMGLVYSAFLAFYTLAMLPGGWFIDRFGARAALAVFAFGSAVLVGMTSLTGMLLAGDAWTLWIGLLLVRSVLGLFNAPLHPACANVVYDRVPAPARGLANGMVTFAACLGIAATYKGMGLLMDAFGWPLAFAVTSGLTLIVASVWVVGTRGMAGRSAASRPPIDPAGLWQVLRKPSVICITLSYSAQGYFQYVFFYWLQYFFETVQHLDRSVARNYTTIIILVMGVGMVAGGWLTDRASRIFTGRLRWGLVPALALAGSGIAFELGLLTSNPRGTLAAFTVAAGLIGACEAAFWTVGVRLGGRYGGTTGGLMNTGGNVGGTISPYVTPLLGGLFAAQFGEDVGWRMGLAVAGAIVIIGAGLWWGVRPDEEHV